MRNSRRKLLRLSEDPSRGIVNVSHLNLWSVSNIYDDPAVCACRQFCFFPPTSSLAIYNILRRISLNITVTYHDRGCALSGRLDECAASV